MTEPESGTALSYEQARDELVDVVRRLEAGGVALEDSLALWERGEELARICGQWLEGARARLDAALAQDEQRAANVGQEVEGDQEDEGDAAHPERSGQP